MSPTPLPQSRAYAATLRRLGRAPRWIDLPDRPPILALDRRIGPIPLCYLPRADLRGAGADLARQIPRSALTILVPEVAVPLRGAVPILTPQHVAELCRPVGATGPQDEALLARMHGKWRNRLRRALEGPLRVTSMDFDPAAHAPLLDLEAAQRRARGYRSYSRAFLSAWVAANPRQARMYQAHLRGESAAFMLVLLHQGAASYVLGWTGAEGRRGHAHTRLLWAMMTDLFAREIHRIDLGPVDTDSGGGLTRFKLGCGARIRRLGPTLLSPPGFRVSP